jgi:hypothetical protein
MQPNIEERARKVEAYVKKAYGEKQPQYLVKLCQELSQLLEEGTAIVESDRAVSGPIYEAIYDGLTPFRDGRIVVQDDPEWLTPCVLDAIRLECDACATTGNQSESHYGPTYYEVGRDALSLLSSGAFRAWAGDKIGVHSDQALAASYVTYRRAGQRCSLHLDNPLTHGYNCLIGLHLARPPGKSKSMLRIFDRSHFSDIDLRPGRVILFDAACTPHARTSLAEGEIVQLLSIGFRWCRQKVSGQNVAVDDLASAPK